MQCAGAGTCSTANSGSCLAWDSHGRRTGKDGRDGTHHALMKHDGAAGYAVAAEQRELRIAELYLRPPRVLKMK